MFCFCIEFIYLENSFEYKAAQLLLRSYAQKMVKDGKKQMLCKNKNPTKRKKTRCNYNRDDYKVFLTNKAIIGGRDDLHGSNYTELYKNIFKTWLFLFLKFDGVPRESFTVLYTRNKNIYDWWVGISTVYKKCGHFMFKGGSEPPPPPPPRYT